MHERCNAGEVEHIECTTSPDGEFAIIAGRLQRMPAGGMVAIGVMRYRDHKAHCGKSLRPKPNDVPTRRDARRK